MQVKNQYLKILSGTNLNVSYIHNVGKFEFECCKLLCKPGFVLSAKKNK